MTFLNWATLGVVCALGIVAIVVAAVLILAAKADTDEVNQAIAAGEDRIVELRQRRLSLFEPDPHEPDDAESYQPDPAVDGPVTRLYVEPGWVMFRGGLVHVACLGPHLLDGRRPCAGCAVHLDHVLTGA